MYRLPRDEIARVFICLTALFFVSVASEVPYGEVLKTPTAF